MNDPNGIINGDRIEADWFCRGPRLNLTCGAACDHALSNQRNELTLGVGIAVDVSLGGLD
jgi:hypothetical protein